jgi:2-polyprenyl-3-methyl-5-hydroxy-6-metoxy-1,4-benzoquinol methylase
VPAREIYQRDQPEGVPSLPLTGERTLPDIPEENYWFRRHLVVYEWIAERVRGLRVIDMACGEGYGSNVLARSARSVVGEDANP